ncbi:MAG TPA: twin-arginine translocase TatA/TatE family subunit, partial [Methanosarcina sp.]|nr:twin-arginine translocase TatA/TatE family subunit [Methanosarcina sp.]
MIGTQELIVILIVALFLFGPKKLPELARSLGSAMGEFKKAQRASELELNQFDAYTRKAANIVASEEKEKEKEQKDTPSSNNEIKTDTE